MKLLLLPAALAAITLTRWPAERNDAVERGRYLAHAVAMCVQCHTPRDARGELLADELFRGARMPVRSPFDEAWAFRAPALAGLPGGWSADDLVRFLRTGVTPTGRTASPPMPPFRMTEEDARAVAAYLGSLE